MADPMAILRLVLPQIPSLASTAFWHSLGRLDTSDKWDLKTTITINTVRNLMFPKNPSPIGKVQGFTLKDPGIKGDKWVATTTFPAPKSPGDDLSGVVCAVVDALATGPVTYTRPSVVDTEVEWTGFRSGVAANAPQLQISEQEKYEELMNDPARTGETTILYVHGGAYYLCDPSSHRDVSVRLAKETKGRVVSIRYRLAPQAAFPSQLIDAFLAYLTLLYPPPGSFHSAVPASKIVFAGDSAGGNLAMALLQLILQLRRTNKSTVSFHGKQVDVPLPAGVAANSGWFDITRAMPSLQSNAKYDYLPAPNDNVASRWPHDALWPTTPPRGDLFCELSLLDHPLTSVLGAESWAGSPPLWLCNGEEMLSDEIQIVARKAVEDGVTVEYEQFEGMPHVFNQILKGLGATEISFGHWSEFCRRCVEEPSSLKTKGRFYAAKTNKLSDVDVETISKYTVEEAKKLMSDAKGRRLKGYEGAGKAMPAPAV